MKISKKTVVALCIIVSILALVAWFILYVSQQPNFSKYHSYAVVTENGDIALTDEQFQRVIDVYKNDKLTYNWLSVDAFPLGWEIHLYETNDLSGDYVIMRTGNKGSSEEFCISVGDKYYFYEKGNNQNLVSEIIREAINQPESEQEL